MSHAHIAILGAGPTGLEAALRAAEAGLDFMVFEMADGPAGNVRSWEHVQLFTPWSMNVSRRARETLEAAAVTVPEGESCPTGRELVQELLEPIAQLPDIAPRFRFGARVLEIGRDRRPHESCPGCAHAAPIRRSPGRSPVTSRRQERLRMTHCRTSTFLMRVGWQQVDEVFSLLTTGNHQ